MGIVGCIAGCLEWIVSGESETSAPQAGIESCMICNIILIHFSLAIAGCFTGIADCITGCLCCG